MKRSQPTVTAPTDTTLPKPVGGGMGEASPFASGIRPGSRSADGLTKVRKAVGATSLRRGIIGLAVFIGLWQVATSFDEWVGPSLPIVARLPPPSSVLDALFGLVGSSGFWQSAYLSFVRVMWGFIAAMVIGIPFGLLMAVSRTAKAICFPPFEILRPIPPLAWVPAAIIFWPTTELSITFVTFLGAFFTVVINTVGGAEQIDRRFLLAARSMGADKKTIFRKVLLPATLPSIATGAVVGMGITWQVVVAAEMISGGGGGTTTGGGGGLGFLIWNSYLGGAIPQVVVGMIGLGVAGYVSSTLVRMLSTKMMPWKRAT
jgi:NitT/TauT family transport system permease protein